MTIEPSNNESPYLVVGFEVTERGIHLELAEICDYILAFRNQ